MATSEFNVRRRRYGRREQLRIVKAEQTQPYDCEEVFSLFSIVLGDTEARSRNL
jgi:hypothetical protein